MRVAELIERLAELDPHDPVYVGTLDDREMAMQVHVRTEHGQRDGGRTVLIEGAWDL